MFVLVVVIMIKPDDCTKAYRFIIWQTSLAGHEGNFQKENSMPVSA